MIHDNQNTRTARRGFFATILATLGAFVAPCTLGAARHRPQSASNQDRISSIGRRVVTGVDAQGRSRVESDQPISRAKPSSDRPLSTDFWVARQLPATLNGPLEPTADWRGGNQAPAGGVIGRLLTWPPGYSYQRHTTPSLDFIIVMAGQLELILDTESKILNPGDVVIQRGTAHAWRVSGSEPCTFIGIMLDAQPSR